MPETARPDPLEVRAAVLEGMVTFMDLQLEASKRLREELQVETLPCSPKDRKRAQSIYLAARKKERELDKLSPWYTVCTLLLAGSDVPVEPDPSPRPFEVEIAEIYEEYARAYELAGTRWRQHARYVADRLRILYLSPETSHGTEAEALHG